MISSRLHGRGELSSEDAWRVAYGRYHSTAKENAALPSLTTNQLRKGLICTLPDHSIH